MFCVKWNMKKKSQKKKNEVKFWSEGTFVRSRACTQIAFINNWRINNELIWIWNAGHHSASMVKASTIPEKQNTHNFIYVRFFFFRSLFFSHQRPFRSMLIVSLVIKAFKILTSTPNAHNLIFRFYDGAFAAMRKLSFFLLSFYHDVFSSSALTDSLSLSFILIKIIQACNSYAHWTERNHDYAFRTNKYSSNKNALFLSLDLITESGIQIYCR